MIVSWTNRRCDRCGCIRRRLYLSEDLSAKNVEIVGLPFYCEECMIETGQDVEGTRLTFMDHAREFAPLEYYEGNPRPNSSDRLALPPETRL